MNPLDGFYAGYMSSPTAYGFALFVFRQGAIVGVDGGGVKFDGTYATNVDGEYVGSMNVDAPPNISLIQGISTGSAGLKYSMPLILPKNFIELPFMKIETPFGPVHVRLERLRDLPC